MILVLHILTGQSNVTILLNLNKLFLVSRSKHPFPPFLLTFSLNIWEIWLERKHSRFDFTAQHVSSVYVVKAQFHLIILQCRQCAKCEDRPSQCSGAREILSPCVSVPSGWFRPWSAGTGRRATAERGQSGGDVLCALVCSVPKYEGRVHARCRLLCGSSECWFIRLVLYRLSHTHFFLRLLQSILFCPF